MSTALPSQRQLSSSNASQPPPQCRICLQQPNDPRTLISPCACRGSIQFVHLHCLQQYLAHRYRTANSAQRKRMKRQLECEICKGPITQLRVLPKKRCITCDELQQTMEMQDCAFLVVFGLLYIGFHGVGLLIVLQQSLMARIIGGIWLLAAFIGFNLALYKIVSKICVVRDPTVQVVEGNRRSAQVVVVVADQGGPEGDNGDFMSV